MKKPVIIVATAMLFFSACQHEKKEMQNEPVVSIQMPYKARFSSDFNDKVSDSGVLNVLNFYKDWENADMNRLSGTFNDSAQIEIWNGTRIHGSRAGITKYWSTQRDSMSDVKLILDTWAKLHSIDKSKDFVLVSYKEIDAYKNGKVDTANYTDISQVKHGKILWFSQYRQELKQR